MIREDPRGAIVRSCGPVLTGEEETGGTALANEDERDQPPAGVTASRQKPPVTVAMPNARHFPHTFGRRIFTHGGKGSKTTVFEPWVDVQADVDAINRGEGFVDTEKATIWINGRTYGYHSDRGSKSRLFPKEGVGTIQLLDKHVRALEKVIAYNGLNERSERFLQLSPHLAEDDRELIRRVWRIHAAGRSET